MISKLMPSAVLIFGVALLSTGVVQASVLPAQTLQVQFTNEPTQYDPLMMEDGLSMRLAANVLGHLHEYDGGGVLQKVLVQKWTVHRDQRRVTIEFKKGIKWSDGVDFVPEHFLRALERIRDEPVKVATSQFFPKIDFQKTKTNGVILELVLVAPDPLLAHWTTLSALAPIRSDMIESYQKRPQPVMPTLGAYQVVDYKREDYLQLKLNPHYVLKKPGMLEEVKIRFIKDEAALVSLLKAGTVDVLFRVPVLQQEEIKKVGRIVDAPAEAVTYLGFNTKVPPFDQLENRIRVRDVLYRKKSELAAVLKTDELPAQLFAADVLWHAQPKKPTTPPAPSRTDERISFEIQSDVSSRNQTMMEFIQSELKRELGWKVKLDMQEWKSHYAKIKAGPKEIYRFGWQNPVSDPYLTYQVLGSSSPNNFTGWSSAEYDSFLAQIRQEIRFVKKVELMRKLEDIIWKEAPVVPLLHQVLKFGVSKRVTGFRANSFGVVHFKEIRL
jgi:ABC-type transport system substrate-binding protein